MKKPAQELLRSYGTTGIQTPIRSRDGKLVGTQRLHDPSNDWGDIEGVETQQKWLYAFNTHSGKAILLKLPWKFAGWIQFFDAVKPRAEVHPKDAAKRGIESGDWVEVVNDTVYIQTGQPNRIADLAIIRVAVNQDHVG